MKSISIVSSAIFAILVWSLSAMAQNPGEAKIIAVKMDAEWCGKCQVMNPKLDSVMPEFEGKPVFFTRFDMTDDFTTEQAGFLANKLGLMDLYNEHKGQTGYMLLLDAETHEVLKRLTSDQSEETLISDINALL